MTAIIRRGPNGALTLVEPFYRPTSLIDEVEAMAKEVFDSWKPAAFRTSLPHSLDIYREKDELVVKADLPGIKKKDLAIGLEDDVLTMPSMPDAIRTVRPAAETVPRLADS